MKEVDLRGFILDISMNSQRSEIEVTQAMRPDPNWFYMDRALHSHQWSNSFNLPSLKEVIDIPAAMGFDEDGEFEEIPAYTHYECKECGERIEPGYKSDETTQYIAGLQRAELKVGLKVEKATEMINYVMSREKILIKFMDGLDPIVGQVIHVEVNETATVTIRRTA
jgi:DNA-directed RNA polymerase subunit RPC12/RpoP